MAEQLAAKGMVAAAQAAQREWTRKSLRSRLQMVSALHHEIAAAPAALAETVPLTIAGSLNRSLADTLVAEVLPLLEACRFLEREAEFVLAPRLESASSRPAWLGGVSVETHRDPLGVVLIIAPANYPLFLPAVQVMQALVAGNAVLWKPAPGGTGCALAVARMLAACGLSEGLLTILGEEVPAAIEAMHAGVDKVALTGSAATGRAVLRELAETLTPSVMELSGCDAVFVLPGADLDRVAAAVAFSMRFNGSATCMAPRRLFVTEAGQNELIEKLTPAMRSIRPVPLPLATRSLLSDLVEEATLYGARVVLDGLAEERDHIAPTLLVGVTPEMRIAKTDISAPVLSVITGADPEAAYAACPYALSAAVFGRRREAEALAARLHAGTVVINDLIVPTADPRVSFSGRGQSGFGSTRGREGLLEMTAVKTIVRQRSMSLRAYQATGAEHAGLFAGLAQALHARGWRARIEGVRRFTTAARRIR